MNFFTETRTKRNTAFVVLLVMLFALASGVANACLLNWSDPHPTESNVWRIPTSQTTVESVALLGSITGHEDDSDVSEDSCLKVCDEGANALTKVHSGGEKKDPGLAPWFATLWTGSQQLVSASRRVVEAATPIADLPLRVRYSRLAL